MSAYIIIFVIKLKIYIMRSKTQPIFFIIFLLILSCNSNNRSEISSLLDRADSLALSTTPIKADYLLDSIPFESIDQEPCRIKWKLLRIKTDDKLEKMNPVESLAILDSIEDYYEKKDPSSLAMADTYYYKGRAYAEISNYPAAIDYFLKALDITADSVQHACFESIIYSQIAFLYFKSGDKKTAVTYDSKSLKKAYLSGNTKGIAESECCLGSSYAIIKSYKDADVLYDKAYRHAEEMNDSALMKKILAQKAHILLEKKDRKGVDSILNIYERFKEYPEHKEFIKGFEAKIYVWRNDDAKAAETYKWLADSGMYFRKAQANKYLFNYYIDRNDLDMARKYGDRAIALYDSIRGIDKEASLSDMENNKLLQREAYEKTILKNRIENEKRSKLFFIILTVILLEILAAMVLKLRNPKNEKNEVKEQNPETAPGAESVPFSLEPSADYQDFAIAFKNKVRKKEKLSDDDWIALEKVSCAEFIDLFKMIAGLNLNEDDLKVILLLSLGYKNKEIGEILFKSPNTISSARARIAQKYLGSEAKAKDLDEKIRSITTRDN